MGLRAICTGLALVVGLVLCGPAAGAPSRASRETTHTWHVSLQAPAQFNLTFAELRFAGRGAASLRLSLTKAPGLYYAAGALVEKPVRGGPRALVVVINERPAGSTAADRTTIGLHVTGVTTLGKPAVEELRDPLPGPAGAATTAHLCGLGPSYAAAGLARLLSAGRGLAPFSATAVVAEAYEVACGLPYDPAFGRAVTDCSSDLVAGCCPANATCPAPPSSPAPGPPTTPSPGPPTTPTPGPPTTPTPIPSPPVCGCPTPPCVAQAGYACPLAAAREATRVIACPLAVSIAC